MISLLVDLVSCQYDWGFRRIFVINVHGDPFHLKPIIKAVETIKSKLTINLHYLLDKRVFQLLDLSDADRINIVPFESEMDGIGYCWSNSAEVNAGGEETSSMLNDFPNSVFKANLTI